MKVKSKHTALGLKGEILASDFLIKNGYAILERNWRHGRDEIDVIAWRDQVTVFVEVKTRTSGYFGFPEDAVSVSKQERMARAAEAFILKRNIHNEIRFDIISIQFNSKPPRIRHIRDAFFPST